MKFFIFATLLVIAAARPQQQAPTTPVPILKQLIELKPDGSYQHSFEAGNGIKQEESGQQKQFSPTEAGTVAKGSVSYKAPDGTVITLTYVADENGFQPKGSHLPTPPPLPAAVAKVWEDLKKAGRL